MCGKMGKVGEIDKEIHLLWVVGWSDGFRRKPIITAKSVGEFSTENIYSPDTATLFYICHLLKYSTGYEHL